MKTKGLRHFADIFDSLLSVYPTFEHITVLVGQEMRDENGDIFSNDSFAGVAKDSKD